jgi:hypothetical protein
MVGKHSVIFLSMSQLLFPKYHITILLGDFNVEVGREVIFKPTIANESLH